MKTLEDVIKAYECKKSIEDKCNKCPYFYECDDKYHCECEARDNDTLHYLKTIETTENLYHNAVNELNKWKDEDWKDRCLPLTWDELKTMEGKPVWVEYLKPVWVELDGAIYDAEWCIVKDINDDVMHDTEGYGYGRANKYGDGYGVGWQAYRKERELGSKN